MSKSTNLPEGLGEGGGGGGVKYINKLCFFFKKIFQNWRGPDCSLYIAIFCLFVFFSFFFWLGVETIALLYQRGLKLGSPKGAVVFETLRYYGGGGANDKLMLEMLRLLFVLCYCDRIQSFRINSMEYCIFRKHFN